MWGVPDKVEYIANMDAFYHTWEGVRIRYRREVALVTYLAPRGMAVKTRLGMVSPTFSVILHISPKDGDKERIECIVEGDEMDATGCGRGRTLSGTSRPHSEER